MSSYANHVWTQARQDAANNLVTAALNIDDDGFQDIIEALDHPDLLAVTAILAEILAELLAEFQPANDDGTRPQLPTITSITSKSSGA